MIVSQRDISENANIRQIRGRSLLSILKCPLFVRCVKIDLYELKGLQTEPDMGKVIIGRSHLQNLS